jgi:two-component system response regulator FlrC
MQIGSTLYPNDFLLSTQTPSAALKAVDQATATALAGCDSLDANAALVGSNASRKQSTDSASDLFNDVKQHEFRLIAEALQASQGSKKLAAEQLGMSPRTLRYKMAKMREAGYQL